jgi:hypothetical protein
MQTRTTPCSRPRRILGAPGTACVTSTDCADTSIRAAGPPAVTLTPMAAPLSPASADPATATNASTASVPRIPFTDGDAGYEPRGGNRAILAPRYKSITIVRVSE